MSDKKFTVQEFLEFLKKSGNKYPTFLIPENSKLINAKIREICQLNKNHNLDSTYQEKVQLVKRKHIIS